jgi:hypothetical protein
MRQRCHRKIDSEELPTRIIALTKNSNRWRASASTVCRRQCAEERKTQSQTEIILSTTVWLRVCSCAVIAETGGRTISESISSCA